MEKIVNINNYAIDAGVPKYNHIYDNDYMYNKRMENFYSPGGYDDGEQ